MTISERQRQKKLQKKNAKRKLLAKSERAGSTIQQTAASFAQYPVQECLMPSGLFELGIGTLIWARRTPDGRIAAGFFLVDPFCLGVKDAVFRLLSEQDYELTHKRRLAEAHEDQVFEPLHPTCAKKLIEGAVRYAEDLGFTAAGNYRQVKAIFGDVDAQACPTRFTYGRDGKPFYVRSPAESIAQARRIVDRLDKRCGAGNYNYLVMLDAGVGD